MTLRGQEQDTRTHCLFSSLLKMIFLFCDNLSLNISYVLFVRLFPSHSWHNRIGRSWISECHSFLFCLLERYTFLPILLYLNIMVHLKSETFFLQFHHKHITNTWHKKLLKTFCFAFVSADRVVWRSVRSRPLFSYWQLNLINVQNVKVLRCNISIIPMW